MIVTLISLVVIFGAGVVGHIVFSKSPVKKHSYEEDLYE